MKILKSCALYILCSTLLFACSQNTVKKATQNDIAVIPGMDAVINNFVEIQTLNFEPTVNYCSELEPSSSKKIKLQYTNYIAFYRKSMLDIWSEMAKKAEYKNEILEQITTYKPDSELMDMQSTQGARLLSLAQSKPSPVCAKIAQMMASETKDSLQMQVENSFAEYRKRRTEFCAKIPKPENCK